MKTPTLKLVLAAAVVAGLGAVVGTFWIGSKVREETVVANPYEEGLRQGEDRAARERLRWDVRVEGGPVAAGAGTMTFAVVDGEGRPLDGAEVEVAAGRPDTSRDVRRVKAVAIGPGRWAVDTGLSGRGEWLVSFDVTRGQDRLRLEKTVRSGEPCDLSAGPCTLPVGAGEVTLELGPRPLRSMSTLAAVAQVRRGGQPLEGAEVTLSLLMPGMDMGRNVSDLKGDAPGRYVGGAVVVRCLSGRRDWSAELTVAAPGEAPATARFPFTVSE